MSIQRALRKSLRRLGWDVRRVDPLKSELSQLVRQLLAHRIDLVFDVGANVGQFAEQLRYAGYVGRIVSFEASSAAHSTLTARARHDANWIVAPRRALGEREGTVTLNLAGNSVSSSVLPMLSPHVGADLKSRYVGSESTELCPLDKAAMDFVSESDHIFLKLDVQGLEDRVLQGARELLPRVQGIQIELSLVPLYEGERLFHPMLHDLEECGYEIWSLLPGFADPRTGRMLQLDAVLFRAGSNSPACAESVHKGSSDAQLSGFNR
jgi:FkbM family methyltransferase